MANNINDYINAYNKGLTPKPKKHNFRWLGDFVFNVLALTGIIFAAIIVCGFVCHLVGC